MSERAPSETVKPIMDRDSREIASGDVIWWLPLNEAVPVVYGTAFGPDMDDIVSWREKAVAFLDEDRPA